MSEKRRETSETDIYAKLAIEGSGKSEIDTGVGFLDHMLDSFTRHSLMDMTIKCKGDLHIDAHHTTEDIGIVLGSLLGESIYPLRGRERFGNAVAVMDETAISCDIDMSNRAYLHYDLPLEGKAGEFDLELIEEFFRAFVHNAPMTAHIHFIRGKNRHHIAEATFKAFALALRRALAPNSRTETPSTKGVL